jgi:membrane protein
VATLSKTGPARIPRRNQRPRFSARALVQLIRETFAEWSEDKAPRLGAALAYYGVFSLAPLLVIAVAVAGLVFDPAEAERAVLSQLGGLVGTSGADLVGTMLAAARKPGAGLVASLLGVVGLVFGAMGAFAQLQDAMNTIWEVKPKPDQGLVGMLRNRIFSLTMVLTVGFLLLVSLVISTALSAVGNWVGGWLPQTEWLLGLINFVISLGAITVLFALMFKYVPDVKMAWSDVWLGAVVTAVLFTVGKTAIGIYLGNAGVTSTYGAAGSLVVLLLWVYYSAQVFFLGAEFTQVYANQYGSRVAPDDDALPISETERQQEGLARDGGKKGQPQPGLAVAGRVAPGLSPVVGPYVALPGAAHALVPGRPATAAERGRNYVTALATFVGGLGLGLIVAFQRTREDERPAPERE